MVKTNVCNDDCNVINASVFEMSIIVPYVPVLDGVVSVCIVVAVNCNGFS